MARKSCLPQAGPSGNASTTQNLRQQAIPGKFCGTNQFPEENLMATMITEVYEAFRKVGIPDPEAKHAAEALLAENVSTKADINGAEKSLMAYINEVEKRLSERISREITDVKASIAKQDREMAVMKWMIATAIAGILSLVIKSFFPV